MIRYRLLNLYFVLCGVLPACGSEKDADKKANSPIEEKKNDPVKTDPSKTGSDQKAKLPYVFDPKTPGPAATEGCSTALALEVVLGADYPSGSQTFLVANLAPACFENRFPVLRLKVDKTFRIAAPVSCKKAAAGEFNFECVGTVGQFIADQRVAVPVNVTPPESAATLKAEVEFVVPASP